MNSAFTGMESWEIFTLGILFGCLAAVVAVLIGLGIASFYNWYQGFKADVESFACYANASF